MTQYQRCPDCGKNTLIMYTDTISGMYGVCVYCGYDTRRYLELEDTVA